jgi:hypothetical protein
LETPPLADHRQVNRLAAIAVCGRQRLAAQCQTIVTRQLRHQLGGGITGLPALYQQLNLNRHHSSP